MLAREELLLVSRRKPEGETAEPSPGEGEKAARRGPGIPGRGAEEFREGLADI